MISFEFSQISYQNGRNRMTQAKTHENIFNKTRWQSIFPRTLEYKQAKISDSSKTQVQSEVMLHIARERVNFVIPNS